MQYKSCSKCGRIHPYNVQCPVSRTYSASEERTLRSTHKWAVKSLQIRERANYLCEVCRDQNIFTYNNLEVHHIQKIRDNKDKLLDDFNLICLCVEHHKQADRGELSPDYLKELVMRRENRD